MLRRFHRIGPWLLVATLVWYVAGCFVNDELNNQSLKLAKSIHKSEQHFDASQVTSVVVKVAGVTGENYYFPKIDIVFDPSLLQATIKNENIAILANGAMLDRVLEISLEKADVSRRIGQQDNLTIYLPSSVRKVGISGILNVDVSGSALDAINALNLDLIDNKPTIIFDNFKANKLQLTATDNLSSNNKYHNEGITFAKQAEIGTLDVSMVTGALTFLSEVVPQHIQLNLGDVVSVKAKASFLKAANFSKLP